MKTRYTNTDYFTQILRQGVQRFFRKTPNFRRILGGSRGFEPPYPRRLCPGKASRSIHSLPVPCRTTNSSVSPTLVRIFTLPSLLPLSQGIYPYIPLFRHRLQVRLAFLSHYRYSSFVFTIARMPALSADGSFGQASMIFRNSGQPSGDVRGSAFFTNSTVGASDDISACCCNTCVHSLEDLKSCDP